MYCPRCHKGRTRAKFALDGASSCGSLFRIMKKVSVDPPDLRRPRGGPGAGLAFGILIALLVFIVFKDFLLFEKIFLFKDIGSDTMNEHYPHYVHLREYLRSDGIPRWSFQQGAGQNIFPYSINEPTALLLSLFPTRLIPYAVIYVHLLKILLCGVFFFRYLSLLGISAYASGMGALLYTFCGYMVLGGTWRSPPTEAMFVAFLLYAFERFFKQSRWGLIPVAVACAGIDQPYFLYMDTVFLAAYATLRFWEERGPLGRAYAVFLTKLAGLWALGVLMGAVYVMTGVLQMLQSPRVSGEVSLFSKLAAKQILETNTFGQSLTILLRLFSNDLLGAGSAFRGWGNYFEAPLLYAGLLSLLLLPQFFSLSDRKTRRLYGGGCALAVAILVFPFFRYMINLFSGDYYRTISLFLTILIIHLAVRALGLIDGSSKLDRPTLIVTCAVLLVVLFVPYPRLRVDPGLRSAAAAFLAAHTVLLLAMGAGNLGRVSRLLLVASVAAEMGYFAVQTIDARSALTAASLHEKTGYNDYTVDAVAWLNATDTEFFRVTKDYSSSPAMHYSINDAKIQGFRGTSSYYSFNQINYIRFLGEAGVIDPTDELSTHVTDGVEKAHPMIRTMLAVKYALTRRTATNLPQLGYEKVATFGHVHLYKNNFFLPLGYAYDAYMLHSDFKSLEAPVKPLAFLRACVIDPADKGEFAGLESITTVSRDLPADDLVRSMGRLKENSLAISEYRQNLIRGTLRLDRRKILFLSIPFDRGWTATVNGRRQDLRKVNIGFMGLVLDKGEHKIDLAYEPPLARLGAWLSGLGLIAYVGLLICRPSLSP